MIFCLQKYLFVYILCIIKYYFCFMKKKFLKTIYFDNSQLSNKKNHIDNSYIKEIPVFQNIKQLEFKEPITYFVGENGSGKSTLLENIATTFGFNKEWWTKNTLYQTNQTDNQVNNWLTFSWQPSMFQYGYFFRAEWIYNFVNYLENTQNGFSPYGGENLHKFSHWQQFLKIFEAQKDSVWFYILDEIESALSPANQLKVVEIIKYMVSQWSQFIIATHSPIILNIQKQSQILSFDYKNIQETSYDMTPCVDMYKRVLHMKEII